MGTAKQFHQDCEIGDVTILEGHDEGRVTIAVEDVALDNWSLVYRDWIFERIEVKADEGDQIWLYRRIR